MINMLRKNSFYGVTASVCSGIVMLASIPVFINYIGAENYGIFALYMVVGNLNLLISAGFSAPIVKYVSEQGISSGSSVDISVGLFVLTLLSFLFLALTISFDEFIVISLLNIPMSAYESSAWLYNWLLLSNCLLLVGQAFKAVIDALQKNYLTSIHQFVYFSAYWGLILIGTAAGADLNYIGFLIFISSLIWFIISLGTVRYLYGSFLYFGSIKLCKHSLYKQLSFGSKIFAGSSIFLLFEPLSKVLVSHYSGVVYVGFYDVALRVKGQVGALFARLYYPLFPLFSKEDNLKTISFYVHEIAQKSLIVLAPTIVSLIFVLSPLLDIWLGGDETIYISTLYLLMATLLSSTTIPLYHFLVAKGHASKTILIQLLNTVTNITVFFIFIDSLGYFSIILANCAALMSSLLLCFFYQYKYLDSLVFDSMAQFFKFLLVFFSLLVFAFFVDQLLMSATYVGLLITPICIFILSFFLFDFAKLVCREDIIRLFGRNKLSFSIGRFMNH